MENDMLTAAAESDKRQSDEREYHKAFYGYLRYFSTLGTATIVAIGALEKFCKDPAWKVRVARS